MIEVGSEDTIVAIATPDEGAALGVVRISGPDAVEVAESLFQGAGGQRAVQETKWGALRGRVVLGRSGLTLPAMCLVMRGPYSFTGEDVVELHLPGSLVLLDMILELAARVGARPATAGEFSRRAFLNDRMDLSQMESVGLLINAETESERVAALKGLSGSLRVRIEELAERVMTLLTPLELSIDFSDQDIEIVDVDDAQLRLTALIKEVDEMIASRRSRALGRGGYRVVLVGAANAGKSTLFNRLLGRDAAITSDESGTTRDYLEGDIEVGGVRFRLVDTAGVDQTSAGVEEAAAHLRDLEIESADITLVVAKGTDPAAIMGSVWGAHLLVRTHADVTEAVDRTEAPDKPDTVWVSGLTGAGIGELQEAIRQRAGCLQVARSGGLVLNQRHAEALGRCGGALRRAAEGLLGDDVVELVAADLREALHELERINGRDYDEELLDGILRDFCIGK